jgi:hypothetical protein
MTLLGRSCAASTSLPSLQVQTRCSRSSEISRRSADDRLRCPSCLLRPEQAQPLDLAGQHVHDAAQPQVLLPPPRLAARPAEPAGPQPSAQS